MYTDSEPVMSEYAPIRLLDDHVINKIAAGEVIERPASVVKELVENALDAGATQIDVEIVEGGRKLISVADNGSGMTRDQALLAIERHATSKIKEVTDIEQIGTMGFRGEALAAIPSVSQFMLRTRKAEDAGGTELVIHGGKMLDVTDAGCPPGTLIEVKNLFFNVPARRKFLRSFQTELAHIRQLCLMYALAFPRVGFSLVVDRKNEYQLRSESSMEERLHQLFDRKLVDALKPIDYEEGGLKVTGFAAIPSYHRSDKTGQYVYINRRPASAPLVGYAINQGYENLLPKGRSPVLFLFLDIPLDRVDVNVHPAKKEVRFRRPQETRDVVIRAIRKTLNQQSESSPIVEQKEDVEPSPVHGFQDTPVHPFYAESRAQSFPYPRLDAVSSSGQQAITDPVSPWEERAVGDKSPWGAFTVLGVAGKKTIVLETDNGIVLLNPQAAHERVVFERLVKAAAHHKVESQGLLTPETVSMTPTEAVPVRKNLDALRQMGFGISDFGGDTFLIDALPTCFGNQSADRVIREVATGLEQGKSKRSAGKWTIDMVARAACRSAVTSAQALSMPEIRKLVIDLAQTEMPYTCPHGKPVVIYMSFNELDKKFGR